MMMLGAAVYAFVVGKVSEYVSSKHAAREHFESRVSHLKSYMKKHEVPVELRDRIEKYCRFIRNAEKIKFKMYGLSLLSSALRQELSLCIHIDSRCLLAVDTVDGLRKLPPGFLAITRDPGH